MYLVFIVICSWMARTKEVLAGAIGGAILGGCIGWGVGEIPGSIIGAIISGGFGFLTDLILSNRYQELKKQNKSVNWWVAGAGYFWLRVLLTCIQIGGSGKSSKDSKFGGGSSGGGGASSKW